MRSLVTATHLIQQEVAQHAGNPLELLDRAERSILEIGSDDRRKDFRKLFDVLEDEIAKLHALSEGGQDITGTPSGFKDLDEITGGFQPGNLIILAARPGMGKSALAANFVENAAVRHGKAAVMFSLEMGESELAQRFISSQGSVPGNDLRRGKVNWQKVTSAANVLSKAPLWIDDSSDLSVLDIRAKARRLAQQLDGELGPDRRGLPAADALRQPLRQRGGADRRDLEGPQDARARAARAGGRAVAAQPRGGAAPRQAADALRPALLRPDRAGRRPRDVHLPRGVLRRRGRVAGRGRAADLQAPQRRRSATSSSSSRPSIRASCPVSATRSATRERLPLRRVRRLWLRRRRDRARDARVPLPAGGDRAAPRAATEDGHPAQVRGRVLRPAAGGRHGPVRGRHGAPLRRRDRREPGRRPRPVARGREVGHRQDHAGDADLQDGARATPHGRDLLRAASARPAAADVRRRQRGVLPRAARRADLGGPAAPRRPRDGEAERVGARAALHHRQRALRGGEGDRAHHQPRDGRRSPIRSARARCRA